MLGQLPWCRCEADSASIYPFRTRRGTTLSHNCHITPRLARNFSTKSSSSIPYRIVAHSLCENVTTKIIVAFHLHHTQSSNSFCLLSINNKDQKMEIIWILMQMKSNYLHFVDDIRSRTLRKKLKQSIQGGKWRTEFLALWTENVGCKPQSSQID